MSGALSAFLTGGIQVKCPMLYREWKAHAGTWIGPERQGPRHGSGAQAAAVSGRALQLDPSDEPGPRLRNPAELANNEGSTS